MHCVSGVELQISCISPQINHTNTKQQYVVRVEDFMVELYPLIPTTVQITYVKNSEQIA